MERSSKMQTAKKRHAASSAEQSGKNNKKLRLQDLPKELLYLVLVCTAAVDECAGPRLTCTNKFFHDFGDEDYYSVLCKASDFVTRFDDGLSSKERFDMFRGMTEKHREVLRGWNENTTMIEGWRLQSCHALNLRKLPWRVQCIVENAFLNCRSLALTELPEGVQYIYSYAFDGCTSLALMALPRSVTNICGWTFRSCESLALAELPTGIIEIGFSAFMYCSSLALTELPEGVKYIYSYAFFGCKSLALVKLPRDLQLIGHCAFYDCPNLHPVVRDAILKINPRACG